MEPTSERGMRALRDYRTRAGFGPGRKEALADRIAGSIADGAADSFVAELDRAQEGRRPAAGTAARILGGTALALAAGLGGLWLAQARIAEPAAPGVVQQAIYGEHGGPGADDAVPAERIRIPLAAPTAGSVAAASADGASSEPSRPSAPTSGARRKVHEAASAGQDAASAGTLGAELGLMRGARRALAGGAADTALGLLEEHARTFPGGQLTEERAALRVEALCRLDPARGAAARRAFLREHEASSHARRVRSLRCEGT